MTAVHVEPLDPDLVDFTPDDPSSIPADGVDTPPEDLRDHIDMLALRGVWSASTSASGLSAAHRKAAKSASVAAAVVALHNRDRVHYTQGVARWDGIHNHRFARRGDFPRQGDCSAFVTWCIYQGVRFYDLRDTVNGADWKSGFTGTMLGHGKRVLHQKSWEAGDAIIYGSGGTGEHTALYVGGGMVISFGSEAGPFFLPWNYRSDLMQVRRYI